MILEVKSYQTIESRPLVKQFNPTYYELEKSISTRLRSKEPFDDIINDVLASRKIVSSSNVPLKLHMHHIIKKDLEHQIFKYGKEAFLMPSTNFAAKTAHRWISSLYDSDLNPKTLFNVKLSLAKRYGNVTKSMFLPKKSVRNIANTEYADLFHQLINDYLEPGEYALILKKVGARHDKIRELNTL